MSDDFLYTLALGNISGVGSQTLRQLIEHFGSAANVFAAEPADFPKSHNSIRESISKCRESALTFAQAQVDKANRFGVQMLTYTDAAYPSRLRECPDAPPVLFFKGNVNFETAKILAVVGTRKPSDEGRMLCDHLISDLCARHPDLVIVSGLAFGVDIAAHRAAIRAGRPTIGVVAHGLDTLYPAQHRDSASQMIKNGALLTEFPFGVAPKPTILSPETAL